MEDLPLKIEKIAGNPSENSACGVFSKRITLVDGSIGTYVGCVLLKDGKDEDLSILLRDIFELSTNKLESAGLGDGILEAVELCGEATHDYLAPKNLQVSFTHTFFYKNVAYIGRRGDAIRVLVFEPPQEAEIKFESGSGPVRAGQLMLMATEKFLEKFDVGVFRRGGDIDLEEIIDGLATELSGDKDQAEMGAVFILNGSMKAESSEEEMVAAGRTGESILTRGESGAEVVEEAKAGIDSEKETGAVVANQQLSPETSQSRSSPFGILVAFGASFLRSVWAEIKKLKRGDLGAVFRLRRNIALVIGVIVLILVISASLAIRQRIQKDKLADFGEHFNLAQTKYSEAQAILELNRQKARELLGEADKEIKLALAIYKNDEKARVLSGDIANKLKDVQETKNINFTTLYEAEGPVRSLSFSSKNLVVFAGDKILVGNSKDGLSTIGGVADTKSGFVFDNKAFILSGGKVYKVDLATEKSDDLFDFEASDVAVFLGNVYLPSGDQIAKFVPVVGGYSRSADYLREKANLDAASRLVIDGSVWVTSGSRVLNFLRGENQNFEISGISGQIGTLESIYTSSSLDNIYVVDKGNSALLVIGKDGVYRRAYQSSEFARASDVVISDDEKMMYLGVENKVLGASIE